jgi:uncharacterized membrane protein YphA (DoxX/SURF4 family)
VWVLQVLLALMFIMSGAQKLAGMFPSPQIFEQIGSWAEPSFRYFVGVWELLAGVLIVIPKFRMYGALLLALAMAGAFGSHIATPLGFMPEFVDPSNTDGDATTVPGFMSLIFLALSLVVIYLRRDELPFGKNKAQATDNEA